MVTPRQRRLVTASVSALALALVAVPMSAQAAPPGTIGVFAQWNLAASSTPGLTYEGSASFAESAGMPDIAVTTDSTTLRTPTGESAFLGASTGFGQYFGSSRSQPYLYLSPAAGAAPSTTTITFASEPPAGWGFALGDIDADWVRVVARDVNGAALDSSVLNAQDTDNDPVLNYCSNVPKPSSCAGSGPFTSVPAWLANGGFYNGGSYPAGSVVGQGGDTSGSYDWFLPGAGVRSITVEFHVLSGSPIYQLWLAGVAPVTTVSGTIAVPDAPAGTVPEGTGIALEQPDGTPVLDIEENPVIVPVDPDGGFAIETERGEYQLEVVVPEGYTAPAPIAVDARGETPVDLGTITVAPTAPVDPGVPTDPPATPGQPAAPAAGAASSPTRALAATGVDASGTLAAGAAIIALGALALLTRRRAAPVE